MLLYSWLSTCTVRWWLIYLISSYRTCLRVIMSKPHFVLDENCSVQKEINSLGRRWVSAALKIHFSIVLFSSLCVFTKNFFLTLWYCKSLILLCFRYVLINATSGVTVGYQHIWYICWQSEQIIEHESNHISLLPVDSTISSRYQ